MCYWSEYQYSYLSKTVSSALPPLVSDNEYIASRFADLSMLMSFMESIKFSVLTSYLLWSSTNLIYSFTCPWLRQKNSMDIWLVTCRDKTYFKKLQNAVKTNSKLEKYSIFSSILSSIFILNV